jgi:hypothetical protein
VSHRLKRGPNQHQNNRAYARENCIWDPERLTGDRVEHSRAHFIKLCVQEGSPSAMNTHPVPLWSAYLLAKQICPRLGWALCSPPPTAARSLLATIANSAHRVADQTASAMSGNVATVNAEAGSWAASRWIKARMGPW